MRTANITINQNALINNIQQVAKHAPNTKIMVMLKANAYGHGLDVCTLALLDDPNVQAIGVATMEEALQVRQLGWTKILVLIEGVFSLEEWELAIEHNMQCVIHHQPQLDWALQLPPISTTATATVLLKFNTGMNRIGFIEEEITTVATQLHQAGYQQILTSHFANADDSNHPLNLVQGQLFSDKLVEIRRDIDANIQGSLCNSAGIVNFPDWHYDWVRAGIMIYGSSPVIDKTAKELDLQAVMELSSKVMAIHQLEAGQMVGYGSRWSAKKSSEIAVISIGYGDGYPRVVDDTAFVHIITNKGSSEAQTAYKCSIVGRVSMDMLIVDVTDISVAIDDKVIMWGTTPHIDTIAQSANTIGYELLCRLTSRPTRYSR